MHPILLKAEKEVEAVVLILAFFIYSSLCAYILHRQLAAPFRHSPHHYFHVSNTMSAKRLEKKAVTCGEYDGNDADDDEAFAAASEGEVACLPDDDKRKKVMLSSGNRKNGSREASLPACQADKCSVDLSDTKRYYRRHKVCEDHAKAPAVTVAGLRQRFCQQCSRFHELHEFDESKRSCRSRLAGHNERRRRSTGEYYGENSGRSRPEKSQTRENQCWQPDERRGQIVIPGNQVIR